MQDDRYSKFIGKMAIVPMTYGRHVPIIADRVKACFLILGALCFVLAVFHDIFFLVIPLVFCNYWILCQPCTYNLDLCSFKQDESFWKITRLLFWQHVDKDFGTGVLKISPGHDHNDYYLARKLGLPILNVMNKDGTLNEVAGLYWWDMK
jgi:valyl-tRNA synthetase